TDLLDPLALRIAGAAPEGAEAAAADLHGLAALRTDRDLLLGRGLTRRPAGRLPRRAGLLQIPGVLALGIVAAGDEDAEAAETEEERAAVQRAGFVQGDSVALDVRHLLAGGLQILGELAIEVGDRHLPVDLAVFNF